MGQRTAKRNRSASHTAAPRVKLLDHRAIHLGLLGLLGRTHDDAVGRCTGLCKEACWCFVYHVLTICISLDAFLLGSWSQRNHSRVPSLHQVVFFGQLAGLWLWQLDSTCVNPAPCMASGAPGDHFRIFQTGKDRMPHLIIPKFQGEATQH